MSFPLIIEGETLAVFNQIVKMVLPGRLLIFLKNGAGDGGGAGNSKKRTLKISDWGSQRCPQPTFRTELLGAASRPKQTSSLVIPLKKIEVFVLKAILDR